MSRIRREFLKAGALLVAGTAAAASGLIDVVGGLLRDLAAEDRLDPGGGGGGNQQ